MKTTLCLLTCVVLHASLHAATWTVDNNVSHPADFRNIQEAVDAAAVGDTILVAGSSVAYSTFTTTKRLYIKGQAKGAMNVGVKIYDNVIFDEFSDIQSPDHLRNASGSILESVEVSRSFEVRGMCSGVAIKRCKSQYLNLHGCSGAMVINCTTDYLGIYPWRRNPPGPAEYYGSNNTVVGTWADEIYIGETPNSVLQNCVLGQYVGLASESDGPIRISVVPALIKNSIVIAKTNFFKASSPSDYANVNFDHCLFISDSTLPPGNGNILLAYTNYPSVFVDATPYSTNPDGFVLKENSPAIGAGIGGVDLGMYGGASPFVKDFVPALPRVNNLDVPPVVPHATGLTFEVRAEARD